MFHTWEQLFCTYNRASMGFFFKKKETASQNFKIVAISIFVDYVFAKLPLNHEIYYFEPNTNKRKRDLLDVNLSTYRSFCMIPRKVCCEKARFIPF
jgi:hypothetical protein